MGDDKALGLLANSFSIDFTAYIDGVSHDSNNDHVPESYRPIASTHHVNYWELIGDTEWHMAKGGPSGQNVGFNVNATSWGANLNHEAIDDDATVLGFIEDEFISAFGGAY